WPARSKFVQRHRLHRDRGRTDRSAQRVRCPPRGAAHGEATGGRRGDERDRKPAVLDRSCDRGSVRRVPADRRSTGQATWNWHAIFGGSGLTVLLSSTVLLAMPTALAALGETVSERAGVLNLGLEGMMLAGAMAAFLGDYYTHSPVVGALSGVSVGVL